MSQVQLREFEGAEIAAELARRITDPGRKFPVVALTCRSGEIEPALSPELVVDSADTEMELWILRGLDITMALKAELDIRNHHFEDRYDSHRAPYGGAARIWWPPDIEHGVVSHDLVIDRSGDYGEYFSRRLEGLVKSAGSRAPSVVENQRDEIRDLRAELKQTEVDLVSARAERDGFRRELSKIRGEMSAVRKEAKAVAKETPTARPVLDFESRVALYWSRNIAAPGRTLDSFTLGPEFEESLRQCQVVSEEAVVRVVAKLVGGLKEEVTPRPLRRNRGAHAAAVTDTEGNVVWRVDIQKGTPAAARLAYVETDNGGIRLCSVGDHDDHI